MGPFPLETSADDFKRGASDVFRVQGPSMDVIETAVLAHDGAGIFGGSDWHVRAVEVQKAGSKTSTSFWCDAVVRANEPKTLAASSPGDDDALVASRRHRYKVTVRTSGDRGSGTDANVSIVVYGERGDTGERSLDTSADNFQRGAEDVFFLESAFLGEIRRVKIGHDGSGFGPAWKLDDVVIEDLDAAPDAPDWHRERFFDADAWLDSSRAPFQTTLELEPTSGGQRARRETVTYTVTTRTSDLENAGTDATVSVEITGAGGITTGWSRLPDDRGDPFRRGAADEFRVEGVDVGAVVGVAVRHDGRGSSPAWHLATLDVRNDATGEVATFACEDWISADAPGGLERTLTPAKKPPDSAKAGAAAFKYRVDVVTGSRMGSGTDAKVSIAIDAEGLDSPWAFDFGEQREQYSPRVRWTRSSRAARRSSARSGG